MAFWRPPQQITVKVVGLVWRDDRLLVAEVEDDAGRMKGVRPLGGTLEFGETLSEALIREFREELDCGIEVCGDWIPFENIYRHEGHTGHEIVFATTVHLADAKFYDRERIDFVEANGGKCVACWIDPFALPSGVALYPDGLAGKLVNALPA